MSIIRVPDGAVRRRKRLGRGIGSGLGKTSGRGHNGQLSRSGGGKGAGFEGGQTPLQRRLPKRGFTNIYRKEYSCVNVSNLNRFEEDTEVTPEILASFGLIKNPRDRVKILAQGLIDRKLTVKAHKFSQAAVEKIEAAGGRVEVI